LPETLVLCGGTAGRPRQDGTVLKLDVRPGTKDAARVNLGIERLSRKMLATLPPRLVDLLEIACYVHAADQFTRREGSSMPRMGATWRRDFRFKLPVRNLAFWQRAAVRNALAETIGFLSDDDYAFQFVQAQAPEPPWFLSYPEESGQGRFRPDGVILFSGGLDSLAGAAEALLLHGERVVLVSHRSSSMIQSRQDGLLEALRGRGGEGRLFHVGVTVNKGKEEAREFTQRARSFLFATLGFVVARLFGRSEVLFFENGVVSLNLPIAEHIQGARATRTTHPKVLRDFCGLFSQVAEEDVQVRNPVVHQFEIRRP
jgi:hypothetical protein